MEIIMSGKQRMLAAYRGIEQDRPPVAPEFWEYYPAKVLGVDLIEFEKEVPFHQALQTTFSHFDCEGWGAYFFTMENPDATIRVSDHKEEEGIVTESKEIRFKGKTFSQKRRYDISNPSWLIECPIKDIEEDLLPWMDYLLHRDITSIDKKKAEKALESVKESYLLEGWLGLPFFDFYAENREGIFESSIYDFFNPDLQETLKKLQQEYIEFMVSLSHYLCENTSFESYCIGCSYSCTSLLGNTLWREWDKPVIKEIIRAVHSHGKLVHIHFHGKSKDIVPDLLDLEVDCVCPFEQPPGGDVVGREGLRKLLIGLENKVTFNGNVHTIDTLAFGSVEKVRNEVYGICEEGEKTNSFSRLIVGSGDQIAYETPEENLFAMVDEVKSYGKHERKN
jgi:hypothetical protein